MVKKNIVIVDYGLCNLRSVHNALSYMRVDSLVTDDPAKLKTADAVILPGVGAFEDGMNGLKRKGHIEAINDFVQTGKPFLGICLGMQMLLTKSYEFGEHKGLNLVEGEVRRFENRLVNNKYNFKVPHISWNGLYQDQLSWEKTILEGLKDGEEMYFIHSFYCATKNQKNVLAETEYEGTRYCSVLVKDNIYGCQFHPEKSSAMGLRILKNFVNL